MSLKPPRPGDVIHYRYLWRHQANAGAEDGAKTRASLVVATRETEAGRIVYTCPISSKHLDPPHSVKIPDDVRRLLGLNRDSWIVWNDLNRFVWVGPDVERKADGKVFYGNVGEKLWSEVRALVLGAAIRPTHRTD